MVAVGGAAAFAVRRRGGSRVQRLERDYAQVRGGGDGQQGVAPAHAGGEGQVVHRLVRVGAPGEPGLHHLPPPPGLVAELVHGHLGGGRGGRGSGVVAAHSKHGGVGPVRENKTFGVVQQ